MRFSFGFKCAIALIAALACAKQRPAARQGPVIAEGRGISITEGELKARLDEQSPSIRQTFRSPERKKEFLDTVIRFELLAQLAEKEGLANDPEVQVALRKVLVAKYYERHFKGENDGSGVNDADIRAYYDAHIAEFRTPGRVHAWHVFLAAPAGPDRAAKAAQAKKLLERVLAGEGKDPGAFAAAARESSDDPATKPLGGDLSYKTREELEVYGKPVAEAAFLLGADKTSQTVIETKDGFHLLRVTEQMPENTRTVADVKAMIASRLSSARKQREYEDLLKNLVEGAKIHVDEAALQRVTVAPLPGAHG